MQSTPLTGTTTYRSANIRAQIRDAIHTPYGDNNIHINRTIWHQQRCNPHPLRGQQLPCSCAVCQNCAVDAIHTPYGDNNKPYPCRATFIRRCNPHPLRGQQLVDEDVKFVALGCNPHPLRGQQPAKQSEQRPVRSDAIHTPYGDNNAHHSPVRHLQRMQSTPLTGTRKGHVLKNVPFLL